MTGNDWHRSAVGGLWEEIGQLQFNFLEQQGLRVDHYLLDVGCGSLRGGIHFIRYLDDGHYTGIDKSKELLDAGYNIELKKHNLISKNPRLIHMDNFDLPSLTHEFDFVLAQSVFTHLNLNSIVRCIINVERVLVKGGIFYATFFENTEGKHHLEPIKHTCTDGTITSYCDQDPYHYNFSIFKWICEGTDMTVEYIGDWGHPRDQKMIAFIKR